jgi:hypothetical protein
MTVSVPVGRFIVAVTAIVTGALPQLNVMTPPAVTAVFSLANVQLAGVPVPTTLVGLETSAACPPAGMPVEQEVDEAMPPPEDPLPEELLPEPLLPLEDPLPPEEPLPLDPLPLPLDEPLPLELPPPELLPPPSSAVLAEWPEAP